MTRRDYIKHLTAKIKELDRRIDLARYDADGDLDVAYYGWLKEDTQTELTKMLVLDTLIG